MSVVPAELSELLGMAFAPHASFARSRDSVTMPWPSVNVIGCARDAGSEMLDPASVRSDGRQPSFPSVLAFRAFSLSERCWATVKRTYQGIVSIVTLSRDRANDALSVCQ